MTINLTIIAATGAGFTLLLLLSAIAAERRLIPERWSISTPIYVLSIGIAASSTALSAISFAATTEHGYFTYYFGGAAMFLMGGLLLQHIYRLMHRYNFENLFDLLAFRYRQAWVGPVITLFGVLAILPIIADRLGLLASTITLIQNQGQSTDQSLPTQLFITFLFCLAITLFNFILSAYRSDRRHRNNGLIIIVALTTFICLLALFCVAALSVWQVFGGTEQFQLWMSSGAATAALKPAPPVGLKSALLLSFGSVLCLPHIFHLSFGESTQSSNFNKSFWAFPLLLLLFSIAILPIATAGNRLFTQALPLDYLILLPLYLEQPLISLLVLLAQIAAYFSVAIILCMVATTTLINYLVLPVFKPRKTLNLHAWMRKARRTVGIAVMTAAWLLVNIVNNIQLLHLLFIHAMAVLVQFLPGIVATIYFPKASSWGFILGLSTGVLCYVGISLSATPMVCDGCDLASIYESMMLNAVPISLLVNALFLTVFSYLFRSNTKDLLAADLTSLSNSLTHPKTQLAQQTPLDFITALIPLVGLKEAQHQVHKALCDLKFEHNEQRPFALIQLRNSLETNLSRLLGPSIAQNTINQLLPYSLSEGTFPNRQVEQSLERLEPEFTGIAGEIDRLRRFHRQTLARLPVGVCYINAQQEIMLWNRSLQQLTGLASTDTEGAKLAQLPEPWRTLINDFLNDESKTTDKTTTVINGTQRWLTLHKDEDNLEYRPSTAFDHIIVIEDITDLKNLEDELIHNERLASIGRLAAGVAHEIGNPVTGIACLAQNLKLDSDNPEVLEASAEIIQQTKRISSIMHSLVSFSHGGKIHTQYELKSVKLGDCIKAAIALIGLDRLAVQVNFEFNDHDSGITINGDEQRLHQIFVNLLSNARDASLENSRVVINLSTQGSKAVITVNDQGCGIPKDIQEKVFEPFFTTKEAGQGTGLGLALVYSIVDDHGGTITINSPTHENHGTEFTIQLPMSVAP